MQGGTMPSSERRVTRAQYPRPRPVQLTLASFGYYGVFPSCQFGPDSPSTEFSPPLSWRTRFPRLFPEIGSGLQAEEQ